MILVFQGISTIIEGENTHWSFIFDVHMEKKLHTYRWQSMRALYKTLLYLSHTHRIWRTLPFYVSIEMYSIRKNAQFH